MKRKKVLLLFFMLIILLPLFGCTEYTFFPEDGEWYCDELQLLLSFSNPNNCYVKVNDEMIRCAAGSDKGSSWLSVGCQDTDSNYYALGEEVFGGEFIYLDDEQLILFDPENNMQYIFIRTD